MIMKASHVIIAALLVALAVLIKIHYFPRLAAGGKVQSETGLTIRIDQQAAAIIRDWKRRQGAGPGAGSSVGPGAAKSAIEADLSEFASACKAQGYTASIQSSGSEIRISCQ
jgi:hypothetical protein